MAETKRTRNVAFRLTEEEYELIESAVNGYWLLSLERVPGLKFSLF